jgi:putative two-component system response regulator
VGQELLSMVDHPGFKLAATVAATHHERMDGKGYPCGLAADQITIEARIAAVVSIYVALTQPRPFRKMRSHEDAIGLLQNLAGSQLDPALVDLLIQHQDRFREPDPLG